MKPFAQHLNRGRRTLQRREAAAAALLALLTALPADAVSLREYFGELSDRDRGVYLTGFMDLLRADPQRESAFLDCIGRQGVPRMHAVLTDMVRQEPAILELEVAPWFFYAAHRLCPQSGLLPRPGEPPRAAEPSTPLAAAEPSTPPQTEAERPRWRDDWAVPAGIALVVAAVFTAGALLRRRRAKDRPI